MEDIFDIKLVSFYAGIFINTTGGVSDQYSIEITPSGWTFSIWGVIYFWQVSPAFLGHSFLLEPSDTFYIKFYSAKV